MIGNLASRPKHTLLTVATACSIALAAFLYLRPTPVPAVETPAPAAATPATATAPTSMDQDNIAVPPSAPPSRNPNYIKASQFLEYANPHLLYTRSDVALVMDDREGVVLYGRNIDEPRPIASLTKLMTALIILKSGLPLDQTIEITRADRDRLRGSGSRIPFGVVLTRYDALHAALGASDNRAAAALARTYPGGTEAFVAAMNAQAKALGMTSTHYVDSSGLDARDVSTALDLARLASAVHQIPLFHTFTTTGRFSVTDLKRHRTIAFFNTNRLVRNRHWKIALSKTGYTSDAGECLLMQTRIGDRPVTMVLLDSWGRFSRYGDAERVRNWLVRSERHVEKVARANAI